MEENKFKQQTFSGKCYAAGQKFQWLRKKTATDQIKKSKRSMCLAQSAREERTGGGGCSGADPRARMGDAVWRFLPAQNKLPEWEAGVIFVIWMTNVQCSAIDIQISVVQVSFETLTIAACEYLPNTSPW